MTTIDSAKTNRGKIKKLIWLVSGLLAINLIFLFYFLSFTPTETAFSPTPSLPENNNLKVIFLDVGQGDAILIQTEAQQNILIDGGPDSQIIYKLDQYIPLTSRKIDLAVLTHADPDHLNGLIEVLKRYKVKQVMETGLEDNDLGYREWKKLIQEKQIPKILTFAGQIINLNENLKLEVLSPSKELHEKSSNNLTSIVAKLSLNQVTFLLTGDAPKEIEQDLIQRKIDLKSDVLKVGHHGSKTSTTLEFLKAVKPKYAVISVGENNKFGHPSLRVLKNLEKVNAQILRTDQMGDIIFTTDGEKLEWQTTE